MSRLGLMAELEKLARMLDIPADKMDPLLLDLPFAQLREIRRAISERTFQLDETPFRRLARLANLIPTWLLLWLAQARFGALISARVASLMSARRAARAAERMPPEFLADVAIKLDPRYARDILVQISSAQIVAVVHVMIQREEFMTMGRFVDYLADDTIQAVIDSFEDEEPLVRIAYYMESKNRLDHVVRMMPLERLRRAILMVLEPERDLMLQLMSLVFHVSYGLQQELAELAAEQEEGVLNEIVRATQQHGLWCDLLPVIAQLTEASQSKVVNLPILREEEAVLESIMAAAEAEDLWRALLPLIPLMGKPMQIAVASIADGLCSETLERIANAALMGEFWLPLADIVIKLSHSQKEKVAVIIKAYGKVDQQLFDRLHAVADQFGLEDYLDAA